MLYHRKWQMIDLFIQNLLGLFSIMWTHNTSCSQPFLDMVLFPAWRNAHSTNHFYMKWDTFDWYCDGLCYWDVKQTLPSYCSFYTYLENSLWDVPSLQGSEWSQLGMCNITASSMTTLGSRTLPNCEISFAGVLSMMIRLTRGGKNNFRW